jgi:NADH:ubiquinone oxidoreductase subunit 6 (subunit J)
MLCLAGIYLVIQAPFVALIQVLVYAGAIMVLFLYVIMLLNPRQAEPIVASVIVRRFWARLLFLLLFFLISAWLWLIYSPAKAQTQWESVPVKTIATRLLTDFLLPFELTSVLLLVAIVGAVLIARRN